MLSHETGRDVRVSIAATTTSERTRRKAPRNTGFTNSAIFKMLHRYNIYQPFRFGSEGSINGVDGMIIKVDMMWYDCEQMVAFGQLLTKSRMEAYVRKLMFLQGEADKNLPG